MRDGATTHANECTNERSKNLLKNCSWAVKEIDLDADTNLSLSLLKSLLLVLFQCNFYLLSLLTMFF